MRHIYRVRGPSLALGAGNKSLPRVNNGFRGPCIVIRSRSVRRESKLKLQKSSVSLTAQWSEFIRWFNTIICYILPIYCSTIKWPWRTAGPWQKGFRDKLSVILVFLVASGYWRGREQSYLVKLYKIGPLCINFFNLFNLNSQQWICNHCRYFDG